MTPILGLRLDRHGIHNLILSNGERITGYQSLPGGGADGSDPATPFMNHPQFVRVPPNAWSLLGDRLSKALPSSAMEVFGLLSP